MQVPLHPHGGQVRLAGAGGARGAAHAGGRGRVPRPRPRARPAGAPACGRLPGMCSRPLSLVIPCRTLIRQDSHVCPHSLSCGHASNSGACRATSPHVCADKSGVPTLGSMSAVPCARAGPQRARSVDRAAQVTLVAESFGGALALRVAAAAPQLLERLVLVRAP